MADNRRRIRKRKRLKVRFGLEEPRRMAFSDDLSSDGIFIKTAMPEKPGERLFLEVTLPDETLVLCSGMIRWAKKVPPNMLRLVGKGGVGVKITGFTQGAEAYKGFVESLLR